MGLTPMDFARQFLQPYSVKGSEIIPAHCPICHGGKSRDKYTFALNYENKTFNCKRGSCGQQGHFTELCSMFGVEPDRTDERSEYIPPPQKYEPPKIKPKPIHETVREYLKLRKISEKTAQAYRIGADDKGNIVFPFYDDKGEHVFNKFRYPRKLEKGERKAWREKGTMPILFGMHLCDKSKPLTIFEGEFDSMAGHEAGIPNCVSVPSGAEDFTWVDTCWDFINQFEKIYIFGDNDEPGKEMISRLSAKLSHLKICVVNHPYKDANEMLYRDGGEAVRAVWGNAQEITPAGLIKLSEVAPLDTKNMPKMRTGITRLNQIIGGFLFGDVTVLTGRSGEGKSTLLSQLMLDAIEGGHKACAYSGELRADQYQYWTDLQAAGRANVSEYFDSINDKSVPYVKKDIKHKIHNWYADSYWMYDNNVSIDDEETGVLKVFETAAKRYDCRVFAIDNLMTVDLNSTNEKDFFRKQSAFVGQVVNFARLHKAHVFLVAHPRKSEGKISKDDIGGSGDIHNRVDNVLSLQRCDDGMFDSTLGILKNRWEGVLDDIALNFDGYSKRLFTPTDGENRQYGWEFLDWGEVKKTEDMPW